MTRVQVVLRGDPALADRCRRWGKRWGLEVDVVGSPAPGRPVVHPLPGRGRREGYRWALHHAGWTTAWPPETARYADGRDAVGDLRVPPGPGPHPVALLLHGGFWLEAWGRDTLDGLAVDLARRGVATWNVEYRRQAWPAPGEDVLAAVGHLAALAGDHPLDMHRVALLGHSAGAQLALWAAPRVTATQVVGLAAITDLEASLSSGLGDGAVERLLPRRDAVVEASPIRLVPTGVPTLLAHAADDPLVPAEQSHAYARAAREAGDIVELVELDVGGHFALIDPASQGWAAVAARLRP